MKSEFDKQFDKQFKIFGITAVLDAVLIFGIFLLVTYAVVSLVTWVTR